MNDQDRRSMPLFSIGVVKKLTELTARQIRYYEEHDLIKPERTSGNQRLYSFNDVDRLLEVKNLLEKGVNLTGIRHIILGTNNPNNQETATTLTDKELRAMLKNEVFETGRMGKSSLRRGELARFFH